MITYESRLPPGRTCLDCVHFTRCRWLVGVSESTTECDWAPQRFAQSSAPRLREPAE